MIQRISTAYFIRLAMLLSFLMTGCTSVKYYGKSVSKQTLLPETTNRATRFSFHDVKASFTAKNGSQGPILKTAGRGASVKYYPPADQTPAEPKALGDYLTQMASERYPDLFSPYGSDVKLSVTADGIISNPKWGLSFFFYMATLATIPSPFLTLLEQEIRIDLIVDGKPVAPLPRQTLESKLKLWMTVYTPLALLVPMSENEDEAAYKEIVDPFVTTPTFLKPKPCKLMLEGLIDAVVKSIQMEGVDNIHRTLSKHTPRGDSDAVFTEIDESRLPIRTWALENIAISDLSGRGLDSTATSTLSDTLRATLAKSDYFEILSRRNMAAILEEQEFQQTGLCDDNECLVEMGRILAVKYMLGGSIGKVSDIYQVSLQLVSVETAEVIASYVLRGEAKGELLFLLIEQAAKGLCREYEQVKTQK